MTASAVTETKGLKMNICPGLNELDFGDWEDCTWGDIEVHHPKEYEIYSSRLWEFRAPGGESQSEASERLENALHQIARKHRGETVAVVSHGIAMRGFISKLRFGDYNHVYDVPHCDNTGVTKLIFQEDGSVTVDYYGDNSHLDKLTSRELSENSIRRPIISGLRIWIFKRSRRII